jgi:hypothetical protein
MQSPALLRLHLIRRQEHPHSAGDDFLDAVGRGGGGCLEDEGEEQRGLAHQHELRGGELAVGNRKLALRHMRFQIDGQAVDVLFQHTLVKAPADLRHPLGNRHHRADGRSATGPADHRDIGLAEFVERRRHIARRLEVEGNLALFDAFFLDNRLEESAFVDEIHVKRALGNAGSLCDLAHAGAIETEVQEHLAGALEDLAALGGILLGSYPERVLSGCNHRFRLLEKILRRERPRKGLRASVDDVGNVP